MSDKEAVLELVKRLPSEISMRDILEEIEGINLRRDSLYNKDLGFQLMKSVLQPF
jgi:hypothetical protein